MNIIRNRILKLFVVSFVLVCFLNIFPGFGEARDIKKRRKSRKPVYKVNYKPEPARDAPEGPIDWKVRQNEKVFDRIQQIDAALEDDPENSGLLFELAGLMFDVYGDISLKSASSYLLEAFELDKGNDEYRRSLFRKYKKYWENKQFGDDPPFAIMHRLKEKIEEALNKTRVLDPRLGWEKYFKLPIKDRLVEKSYEDIWEILGDPPFVARKTDSYGRLKELWVYVPYDEASMGAYVFFEEGKVVKNEYGKFSGQDRMFEKIK